MPGEPIKMDSWGLEVKLTWLLHQELPLIKEGEIQVYLMITSESIANIYIAINKAFRMAWSSMHALKIIVMIKTLCH
jgi:hypothetical protein